MVSKASEDFPEPETPVITVMRLCGISSEMFLRLCSRAPRMEMVSSNGIPVWFGDEAETPILACEPTKGYAFRGIDICLTQSYRGISATRLQSRSFVSRSEPGYSY